ncbi:glutaminyl-peptide cyclotransferase [Pseudonocardia phyllosphaerae]|uniref:glutaminyl-peptide cyclotransferase n=1 Tax=Pseudonocardia phyllosphaerae TaxID=3390502 RepID=UPI003979D55F
MPAPERPRLPRRTALLLPVALAAAACTTGSGPGLPDPGRVPVIRPQVLAELPHDTTAFTQGLELRGGTLYEGTGREGLSQLRTLDPATGALRDARPLPGELFGEGLTVSGGSIWQLTWKDGVALEWDRASLTLRRTVPLDGQGWGLCRQELPGGAVRMIRSDGSDRLRFHDATDLAETAPPVPVTLNGAPVPELNELECVGDRVWANVWQTDRIVRIDPATGVVDLVVDAAGLLDDDRAAGADVLNGIAHVAGDEYLLTGKLWPSLFRVRLVAPPG